MRKMTLAKCWQPTQPAQPTVGVGAGDFNELQSLIRNWILIRVYPQYRSAIDTEQLVNDVLFGLHRLRAGLEVELESDELVRVAYTLTKCSVINAYKHYHRQKRTSDHSGIDANSTAIEKQEYGPESIVALTELKQKILKILAPDLSHIVSRKLDGWSNREIALEQGVSKRSIERRLDKIEPMICELVLNQPPTATSNEQRATSNEQRSSKVDYRYLKQFYFSLSQIRKKVDLVNGLTFPQFIDDVRLRNIKFGNCIEVNSRLVLVDAINRKRICSCKLI